MRNLCYALVLTLAVFISYADAANIENGKKLFNDPGLGGSKNGKSCNTCHSAGKDINAEKFAAMKDDSKLEGIVNKCIEGTLAGKALPKDSKEMADIVAYMKSLGKQK
ncbi:MAG: cytochrome C [Nitrospirae bacterium]|nr:cytochrome C [Nitrospirota bacterium]